MSHTNSTPNYSLPQFVSTDKPAWLTDVNPAYLAIDTAIDAAKDAADAAQNDATQALSDASSAAGTASSADTKASGAVASLAPTFDTTATYVTGQYVVYNSLLYICIADVSTPGAWSGAANWSRAYVANQIPASSQSLVYDPVDPDTSTYTKIADLDAKSVKRIFFTVTTDANGNFSFPNDITASNYVIAANVIDGAGFAMSPTRYSGAWGSKIVAGNPLAPVAGTTINILAYYI